MAKLTEAEILEELRNYDTPSITNVVATYPKNPLCLGLYNPLDGELVYRPIYPLYVSRIGSARWICGHMRVWIARPQLLTFDLYGCN